MRNWSGHVEFTAESCVAPASLDELRAVVAASPRIRALGTAHSFNDLADAPGLQVSVAALPQQVEIDSDRRVARIPAGMRYGTAARLLEESGWAFANMASLGHISVAGTIATGTHGSGDRNQTLSASVTGLDMVTATGDVVLFDAGTAPDGFSGMVVALGALGVVSTVSMRIEPTFQVRQDVFDGVTHGALLDDFDTTFSRAYSVSYFTTWGPDLVGQVWLKSRVASGYASPPHALLDGVAADGKRHPLPGLDPVHCTDQLGVPAAWHERLPHFRLDFTPSSGDELQTEYLVPRDHAVALLRELEQLAPRIHALLHVSEIRSMSADDLWLSGAFGRDTVGIHFTWQKRPEVLDLLPELDDLLGGAGGRPHWGKLYAAPPGDLARRYPRFDDFAALATRMDPTGKFRNRTLDELLSIA
jgi:alditol oxidase